MKFTIIDMAQLITVPGIVTVHNATQKHINEHAPYATQNLITQEKPVTKKTVVRNAQRKHDANTIM